MKVAKSITGRPAVSGLTIKAETATGWEIEGYTVLFDNRDLEGQRFSKDTDYWLDYYGGTKRPLMWDHAFDSEGPGIDPVGKVTTIKADDRGLWFEAVIDRASQYAEMVRDLIEMGVVGVSSGAPPHMVRFVGDTIKSWPLIEISLTPTPAEPGTIGAIDTVKRALEMVGYKSIAIADLDNETEAGATVAGSKQPSAAPSAEPPSDQDAGSPVETPEDEIEATLELERAYLELEENEDDEDGSEREDHGEAGPR